MNESHNNLDPRLGAQYTHPAPSAPASHTSSSAPRPDSSKLANFSFANPPAQPYYHYPSPQTHTPHTPQQSVGASGSQSNQASPENHYHAASDHAGSPEQLDDGNAEDAKRPRACEACRGLKVRCDQDPAHPDIPCKRCAKAGRPCVITQPSRKRQKKADSRVAELEKKLDALTAALHQQQAPPQYASPALPPPPPAGPPFVAQTSHVRAAPDDVPMPAPKRRRTEESIVETPSYGGADETTPNTLSRGASVRDSLKYEERAARLPTPEKADLDPTPYQPAQSPEEVANRISALVSPEVGSTMFNRYVSNLAPHMPAVVFPPGTTAEQVFREKPILYVSILSASTHGQLNPDISNRIGREAVRAIADCVVRNGAKSLELIQAMQVTALWYRPPERAEQTNFYQIIHMAAVMALDIGLGKRFNPAKARRGFGGPNAQYAPGPHKTLPQDSDTLEARRAWLGCYFLCASASMVLRRPNLVRWTNYMTECIEVLESHPDAFASDKLFCQHIKIQHICEEIGLQFLMDDNTANISITDPKVTYALNVLEKQLKAWKEKIPPECRIPSLLFFEHVTSLYLHEIALHFNHNVEDFRLPFTEESLKSVNNTSDTLTQHQMSALEACLKAAHGILDTILGMEYSTLKTLPMLIFFVRCTYAIVVLTKMHVAVCTPNSELGKMMKAEDLKVEYYMDSLIALFSYVAKDEESRPHPKILRILSVLRDWFRKHKETAVAQRRCEQPFDKPQQQPQQEQEQQRQPQNQESIGQTPLHLLSQVATGNQPTSETQLSVTEGQDWNVNSPMLFDYSSKNRRLNATDATFPINTQQEGVYPATYTLPPGDVGGLLDPINPDYGWGTNFEQAMDMALGGMDGLPAAGLDGWFLGDSMAPFGFNGDWQGQGQGQVQTQWPGGA